jgi:hypothetical protein
MNEHTSLCATDFLVGWDLVFMSGEDVLRFSLSEPEWSFLEPCSSLLGGGVVVLGLSCSAVMARRSRRLEELPELMCDAEVVQSAANSSVRERPSSLARGVDMDFLGSVIEFVWISVFETRVEDDESEEWADGVGRARDL